MNIKIITILFVLLLSSACSVAVMKVDENLKTNSTVMKVKGLQGWQIRRVIKFGEFKTSKIKGGWKTGSNIHFLVDYKDASQKYEFTQFDGENNSLKLYCAGDLTMFSTPFPKTDIKIPLNVEDVFKAHIQSVDTNEEWELTMTNPNEIAFQGLSAGELVGKGHVYQIQPVRKLEKGSLGPKIIGYKFVKENKSIAAVQTLGSGKVWMWDELIFTDKLVLAAACSALMIRDDLDE